MDALIGHGLRSEITTELPEIRTWLLYICMADQAGIDHRM